MMDEIVYMCNRCGDGFTLEEGRTVHLHEGDITVCPNCGSDDIEEGRRCKICRDIHFTYDLEDGVCKGCFQDAVDAYKSCLSSLMGWERDCLEDKYGNIDITEEE